MKNKIRIWKEKGGIFSHMWRMHCMICGRRAQYWHFGATLGFTQEHLRRQHKY